MCRVRAGVLLVVLGITACSPAPPEPAAEPTTESVADFLARTLPEGPGGTVIAARGDQILYCEGFGMADREERIPASCDTAYDIMSITKQFTAAAILRLEAMGELRVTDPISTYLGPVPDDKRDITVHHLLTHTAGLVEGLGDDYDVMSRDAMLTQALSSELRSRPGEEFHYSNVGYSMLAAIVETASGIGYERFLERHLFAPAGMTSTGYVLPEWDRGQVAVEYDAQGRSQGRPYDHPWAEDGPHWNLRGNGGMVSTARDMFRWHRALTGGTVLPESARAELFAPHAPIPELGESYAYGWVVRDTEDGRIAWHDGGNGWSLANYAMAPDDGAMAFWVSNHAHRDDAWNLEDLEPDLTLGILDRARTQ
ncbi:serine hydrolase domain-containing protein [Allonocardiopsis opalescens]|uniref:CubicO group peptidase (Beta-lactamase class C family) n=1 Tax=Allonocardiopsis opalescens TaxID=1144618 RepID=A0A2T0QCV6_9ACTN|nr:serine hydrolase domain-containing protein [Allonocardiopsis opalescens]PRY01701.1 CubicO group peptidase (beta-lactamase class C family) [Allonocardiopsis opalescens]